MRRFSVGATIVPGPGWDAVLGRLAGDTVMVIGAVDRGKGHLTQYLLAQAAVPRAAVVSADMGQPSIGVPACLAMAIRRPWRTPDALWFVGETSPARHLLPTVVGTARLAERARAAGTELVVIDTGGRVAGPIARLLKSHKARAALVTDGVAVAHGGEIGLRGRRRDARATACVRVVGFALGPNGVEVRCAPALVRLTPPHSAIHGETCCRSGAHDAAHRPPPRRRPARRITGPRAPPS